MLCIANGRQVNPRGDLPGHGRASVPPLNAGRLGLAPARALAAGVGASLAESRSAASLLVLLPARAF